MTKIAVIFDNFGPYHVARLEAASRVCTLLAVQATEQSKDYGWASSNGGHGFASITLGRAGESQRGASGLLWPRSGPPTRSPGPSTAGVHARRPSLWRVLELFTPDCVFLPGWSRGYSLAGLAWCRARGVPAIVMSESTWHDAPRHAWKEWAKARVLAAYSAALVGGSAHLQYLLRLGMEPRQIFQGYDAVDNNYFHTACDAVRSSGPELRLKLGLPEKYFLASARFIEKKNLLRLIEAYAGYRRKVLDADCRTKAPSSGKPWSLVLLGDGPQRLALRELISTLGLEDSVAMPGFRQYPDLPIYYGLASAFVHASISEPWGLVVNEAMASGLPVLVSNRCGCVPDLVREACNGFIFDPTNVEQLAQLMFRLGTAGLDLSKMSESSRQIVSQWGPEKFACGLQDASRKAMERVTKKARRRPWQRAFFGSRLRP